LEKHVERLQYREGWLLRLLDSRKDPLAYFVLETELSDRHVQGLAAVMESTHRTLKATPLKHSILRNSYRLTFQRRKSREVSPLLLSNAC